MAAHLNHVHPDDANLVQRAFNIIEFSSRIKASIFFVMIYLLAYKIVLKLGCEPSQ